MSKSVTILTGFLGSGKTTFLNALLTAKKDKKFAIIENEFGQEGIDGELVMKPDDSLFEMNNGCLCCTLNDNIYDILSELNSRNQEYDELLIETTGIADPAGVANPFFGNSDIKRDFSVKRVVCLIDVALILDQLKNTEEAIKQIVFADVLLLNKTASVTEAHLNEIKETLEKLNPFAKVFRENDGQFPIDQIYATERDQDFKTGGKDTSHDHKAGHHHHGEIASLSFVFDKPFNEKELQMRLFGYLVFEAKDLYRVKGIIHAKDIEHRLILQSVGQSLVITGGRKWGQGEEKKSRIVFIGKHLDKWLFEQMLNGSLAE
jgi:G3E family GTPase